MICFCDLGVGGGWEMNRCWAWMEGGIKGMRVMAMCWAVGMVRWRWLCWPLPRTEGMLMALALSSLLRSFNVA